MHIRHWWLQLFADGGGDGGASSGGEGAAASGVTPADAAQESKGQTVRDRLRAMGVPDDMLKNRAYDAPAEGTPKAQERTADAAQKNDQANGQEQQKAEKTYTKDEVENIVRRRSAKNAAKVEAMESLSPALEFLAKQYGLDPANMDYKALNDAVLGDENNAYIQQRALDMGVPVDVAKKLIRAEMAEDARQRDAQQSEQQRQIREHLAGLYQQGDEMAKKYPGFDIEAELQNDTFARLTAPGSGLSVEDAYFAVHRNELLAAARQHAAQNISQSIAAGAARPNETGSKKAGTVPDRDPRSIKNMPKDRMEEFVRRARAGEKITPEMLYT